MRIVHKISLVGAIPLFGLLFFAWSVLAPRVVLWQNSAGWSGAVQDFGAHAEVLHSLQQERDATVFQALGGSPGTSLASLQAETDKAVQNLRAQLEATPENKNSANTLAGLNQLASVRREKDATRSAAAYDAMAEPLFAAERGLTKLKPGRGVGRRLLGLVIVEAAKDDAAQLGTALAAIHQEGRQATRVEALDLAARNAALVGNLTSPGLSLSKPNRALLAELMEAPAWKGLAALANETAAGTGSPTAANAAQAFAYASTVSKGLHEILQAQHGEYVAYTDRIASSSVSDVLVRGSGLLLVIILAGYFLVRFSRSITHSLQEALRFSADICAGDLSVRLQRRTSDESGLLLDALNSMADELETKAALAEKIAARDLTVQVSLASDKDQLGKALQDMVASLNELISKADASASEVSRGAREIAGASNGLSSGSTTQAASLQEITASITEINDMTRKNADDVKQALELVDRVRTAARDGSVNMDGLAAAMANISTSSTQISKIIQTVDDIAFQTNLLALNAAVEAARAGKHGKGFAVVAEEVRGLAARSAKAARETARLIEGSTSAVEEGSTNAETTATSFTEINELVDGVAGLFKEISSATNDQASGVAQISDGLIQVDNVVQQSTASAEELASASDVLSNQSDRLKAQLSRFQTAQAGNSPAGADQTSEVPEYEFA